MNAQSPFRRPVSPLSRALAGLLTALMAWLTLELPWAVAHGPHLPWPLAGVLLFFVIAGFALALCGPVVLTGRRPQWWSRLEARSIASNVPCSPFWRRSWPRRPRWLLRASLAALACVAVGNAIITTVGVSDVPHTPKAFVTLALVWCLALGVLGVLILWWRAVPQMSTPVAINDIKHERGA